MDNELYLLAQELRAVAHVMHCIPYISDVTCDKEFVSSIIDVFSDYLYFRSDDIFCRLEPVGLGDDVGFNREAIFGSPFTSSDD